MRLLKIIPFLLISILFIQCKNSDAPIVSETYIDSLITNYKTPIEITNNAKEIEFWKGRIAKSGFELVNEPKYAANLVSRFKLLGDINDVKIADSLLINLNKNYNNTQAGIYSTLVSHAILQHQFKKANDYLQLAKTIGIKKNEENALTFDVDFELGNIASATKNLNQLKTEGDYGYQFRRSKLEHYEGNFDESLYYMKKAATLANEYPLLQNVALSNLADLYTHTGKLQEAFTNYDKSLKLDSADLHSIMGIGWIALQHDNNEKLAEKIFKFVQSKTKSPDPLYKLILVAQHKDNKIEEKKYATEFENIVTDSVYGKMYSKYLIQLYTGVLNNPAKAEIMAKNELANRATPQTYSWYAYALLENNKLSEANEIYKKHVSGKPLEALELYYMGKLMEANKKGYNANEFYKAANENYYDLSPKIARDLLTKLE